MPLLNLYTARILLKLKLISGFRQLANENGRKPINLIHCLIMLGYKKIKRNSFSNHVHYFRHNKSYFEVLKNKNKSLEHQHNIHHDGYSPNSRRYRLLARKIIFMAFSSKLSTSLFYLCTQKMENTFCAIGRSFCRYIYIVLGV